MPQPYDPYGRPRSILDEVYESFNSTPKHYVTYYKCRLHGVQATHFGIASSNHKAELVFKRAYCNICLDRFFQQFLDPMVQATDEEVDEWRAGKSS